MEQKYKAALVDFFNAIDELKKLGIIRSDKYLGDIGEYICKHFYELELASSGREPGHDGYDKDGKVQVKYHGSITKTNVSLGNPGEYDSLLVVLGPNSLLRCSDYKEDFLIYRMSSEEVKNYHNHSTNTYSCGKTPFLRSPDKRLNIRA